ncbi:hypothetical protein EV663_101161 [Rhodovulum bhavnagarense]|uniref:Lipoprotein n=1 Tax=Rhodovulum bhavnagarense TaxID=992286 RepID=A0A4R2RSN0_9RHOB|nr:hypothetical protein [Rhodovulum bhavnagarense]TCP62901.1 hypothetical protein EV663_101161 [Rhodovulum bhavnagarense]
MVGTSKILTVSYGTFSCTLEGFDDSFGTMKAIAEYFRDLAADDRYFGAEPPTPDAEMLQRIAEREIRKRVDAHVGQDGIVLRPATLDAPRQVNPTPPAQTAPASAQRTAEQSDAPVMPEAQPAPADSVAAKLARIRAVVESARHSAPDSGAVHPATPAPRKPDPSPESGVAQPEAAPQGPEDDPILQNVQAALGHETTDTAGDRTARTDIPPEDMAETHEAAPDLSDDQPDQVEDAQSKDARDEAPAQNDMRLADTAEQTADPTRDEFDETVAQHDSAKTADRKDALDEIAQTAPGTATQAVSPRVSEITAAVEAAAGRARARILQIKHGTQDQDTTPEGAAAQNAFSEDAASADGTTQETKPAETETETETETEIIDALADALSESDADDARLPDALEAELQAELAAAAREAVATRTDDSKADIREKGHRATVAESGETTKAAAPQRDAALRLKGAELDTQDGMLRRLVDETNTKLEGPDQKRRLAAIAHLKAAVTATVADRKLEPVPDKGAEAERQRHPYREVLAKVVRGTTAPRTPRPDRREPLAPLMLVSEQRVDRPETLPGDEPRAVRPRRVARVEDLASSGDSTPDNLFAAEQSFTQFVQSRGAASPQTVVEAACAYLTEIEQLADFSRPQVMRLAMAELGETVLREDLLRAFGTMLRSGRLRKIDKGRFTLDGGTGEDDDFDKETLRQA